MSKKPSEKKRDPRQEKLERGRSLLAAWGVHEGTLPEDTPPEKELEILAPLIGRDPACDLLIAERMGRLPVAAAADRLAAWEAEARDKDVKREVRRSLFKLQQKGLARPRQEAPAEPFRLGAAVSEPEGYLGPIDGEGARMAWLVKPGRGGVMGLLTVISDVDGMIFVDSVAAKRQALMETLKESSSTGPLVKVAWRYADALMHAAFKLAPPKPGNMRADYLLSRGEFTPAAPEAAPAPPAADLPAPEAAEMDELLDKSAELFKEREFRTWILPERIARVHLQRMADATSTGLVLSKEAATERVVAIMDEALEEMVGGDHRGLFVRRMEEMAYLFHLQERRAASRACLAVAGVLRSPGERSLKNVSFLRALVFRAFAPYLMRKGGTGEEAAAGQGAAAEKETAEGSSVILDPSKAGISSAPDEGGKAEGDQPSLIIRP